MRRRGESAEGGLLVRAVTASRVGVRRSPDACALARRLPVRGSHSGRVSRTAVCVPALRAQRCTMH